MSAPGIDDMDWMAELRAARQDLASVSSGGPHFVNDTLPKITEDIEEKDESTPEDGEFAVAHPHRTPSKTSRHLTSKDTESILRQTPVPRDDGDIVEMRESAFPASAREMAKMVRESSAEETKSPSVASSSSSSDNYSEGPLQVDELLVSTLSSTRQKKNDRPHVSTVKSRRPNQSSVNLSGEAKRASSSFKKQARTRHWKPLPKRPRKHSGTHDLSSLETVAAENDDEDESFVVTPAYRPPVLLEEGRQKWMKGLRSHNTSLSTTSRPIHSKLTASAKKKRLNKTPPYVKSLSDLNLRRGNRTADFVSWEAHHTRRYAAPSASYGAQALLPHYADRNIATRKIKSHDATASKRRHAGVKTEESVDTVVIDDDVCANVQSTIGPSGEEEREVPCPEPIEPPPGLDDVHETGDTKRASEEHLAPTRRVSRGNKSSRRRSVTREAFKSSVEDSDVSESLPRVPLTHVSVPLEQDVPTISAPPGKKSPRRRSIDRDSFRLRNLPAPHAISRSPSREQEVLAGVKHGDESDCGGSVQPSPQSRRRESASTFSIDRNRRKSVVEDNPDRFDEDVFDKIHDTKSIDKDVDIDDDKGDYAKLYPSKPNLERPRVGIALDPAEAGQRLSPARPSPRVRQKHPRSSSRRRRHVVEPEDPAVPTPKRAIDMKKAVRILEISESKIRRPRRKTTTETISVDSNLPIPPLPASGRTRRRADHKHWRQKSSRRRGTFFGTFPQSRVRMSESEKEIWRRNVVRAIRRAIASRRSLFGHRLRPLDLDDVFSTIDRSKDGLVDEDELATALHRLDISLSESQRRHLFDHIDKNADGRIQLAEFKKLVSSAVESTRAWGSSEMKATALQNRTGRRHVGKKTKMCAQRARRSSKTSAALRERIERRTLRHAMGAWSLAVSKIRRHRRANALRIRRAAAQWRVTRLRRGLDRFRDFALRGRELKKESARVRSRRARRAGKRVRKRVDMHRKSSHFVAWLRLLVNHRNKYDKRIVTAAASTLDSSGREEGAETTSPFSEDTPFSKMPRRKQRRILGCARDFDRQEIRRLLRACQQSAERKETFEGVTWTRDYPLRSSESDDDEEDSASRLKSLRRDHAANVDALDIFVREMRPLSITQDVVVPVSTRRDQRSILRKCWGSWLVFVLRNRRKAKRLRDEAIERDFATLRRAMSGWRAVAKETNTRRARLQRTLARRQVGIQRRHFLRWRQMLLERKTFRKLALRRRIRALRRGFASFKAAALASVRTLRSRREKSRSPHKSLGTPSRVSSDRYVRSGARKYVETGERSIQMNRPLRLRGNISPSSLIASARIERRELETKGDRIASRDKMILSPFAKRSSTQKERRSGDDVVDEMDNLMNSLVRSMKNKEKEAESEKKRSDRDVRIFSAVKDKVLLRKTLVAWQMWTLIMRGVRKRKGAKESVVAEKHSSRRRDMSVRRSFLDEYGSEATSRSSSTEDTMSPLPSLGSSDASSVSSFNEFKRRPQTQHMPLGETSRRRQPKYEFTSKRGNDDDVLLAALLVKNRRENYLAPCWTNTTRAVSRERPLRRGRALHPGLVSRKRLFPRSY